MVPIALFCFAFAGIGLLGLNVWYYRALVNARHDADAYCALARSWQQTAALAVRCNGASASKARGDINSTGTEYS
jgi:hypothetical protein